MKLSSSIHPPLTFLEKTYIAQQEMYSRVCTTTIPFCIFNLSTSPIRHSESTRQSTKDKSVVLETTTITPISTSYEYLSPFQSAFLRNNKFSK